MHRLTIYTAITVITGGALAAPAFAAPPTIERVTTIAPFPRGLQLVDGTLYVLCRGRVRGEGGVSAAVEDQAGTIYAVDPKVSAPASVYPIPERVRRNGRVFARPTDPPFRLWRRDSVPPESDRRTDRPYCVLRYHPGTKSFYICAFSGIDKARQPGKVSFSKNLTDAVLRYDLRTKRWYEVERHDIEAGGNYPHHDPRYHRPPHGWLAGPDNCLPVGHWLYAVAKDNSVLVRYDLRPLARDPEAGHPPSERVLGAALNVRGHGRMTLYGHSALAVRDGFLYLGYRTSSVIVRLPLKRDGTLVRPVVGELVARFDPFDGKTLRSANITDIAFDAQGRLYVVNAIPARVHRFTPDPDVVYDGRTGQSAPWLDLAARLGKRRLKIENLLAADGYLYICSGDGYGYQKGAVGTVYRVRID